MDKDVLTIKQIAEFLQMNERTIYNLVKKRKIPAFKVGSDWRFLKTDIDNWIEQQKSEISGTKPKQRAMGETPVVSI